MTNNVATFMPNVMALTARGATLLAYWPGVAALTACMTIVATALSWSSIYRITMLPKQAIRSGLRRQVHLGQSPTHALEGVDVLVGVVRNPATSETGRVRPLGGSFVLPGPEYPSLSSVLVSLLIVSRPPSMSGYDSQSGHPRIGVGSP